MDKIIISSVKRLKDSTKIEYYTLIDGTLKTYETTDEFVAEKANLVSFDWDNLILALYDNGEAMPQHIVDMEQIAKQLIGRKKPPEKNMPWSIWEILKSFYSDDENEAFIKTQRVHHGLAEVTDSEKHQLYIRMLSAMEACYKIQLTEMKDKGEYQRFYDIERPIRIINLDRTYRGIAVDTENVAGWINTISHDVYQFRNTLQLSYGIISPKDKSTVFVKMDERGLLSDCKEIIEEKGYYFFLKESKLRDPLINDLYQEKKSSADLGVLLSIGALRPKHQQIHPIYDSFGTITARTKMITPNIQHLTKRYRSIIAAHKGKELRYIDYAQFEAGILANDSGDELLIKEYNESDIYVEIGKKTNVEKYISDPDIQRKFCKSLFYKYSYGMDIKNHLGVLKDYQLELHKDDLSPLIVNAFNGYTTLSEFREKIKQEAIAQNRIGTHQGNFRHRIENENNVSWAMSQRIQGTASFILKKAIIRVLEADSEIDFLIPMHDAALFEVPAGKTEEKELVIQNIFLEVFEKECPAIKPVAKFKSFWE